MFNFETNGNGRWKLHILQQCSFENIMVYVREAAQTSAKVDKHQKKVMLCIWRDYQGIIYFEILSGSQRINSEIYINQLTKLKTAIQEKRPNLTNRKGVVFHHDNAKPHTSLVTGQKFFEPLLGRSATFTLQPWSRSFRLPFVLFYLKHLDW